MFLGAVVVAAVVLFAWFPAGSLLNQRSNLADTEAQLAALKKQDAALAQEKKNLSDAGEIGRIARGAVPARLPGTAGLRDAATLRCGRRRHPVRGRPRVERPGRAVRHAGAPARRRHDDDAAGDHLGRGAEREGRLGTRPPDAYVALPRILAVTPCR